MQTTVGQLLINSILPPEMRDFNRVITAKSLAGILSEIAKKYPDKYREISYQLGRVGARASQETGGFSVGMQHLRVTEAARAIRRDLLRKIRTIVDNDRLTPQERERLIIKVVGEAAQQQQDLVFAEAEKQGNPLVKQIVGASRGNKVNLNSLLGSDMLYTDHRDRVIPVPVINSYSEGLRPWEYWAGTYGARHGVINLKFATQDAGYLSKQLNQIAHRLIVVDLDRDGEGDGVVRGVPVDIDDPDNEGAFLAVDTGPYKRNTVLTPKVLQTLRKAGYKKIIVRSPIIDGSKEGGLYARDVGVRENGRVPGRGTPVGFTAVQTISEPLTQAQLSAKHVGGVAGANRAVSGFDYINQLIQVPKHFKGGATHAEVDGVVSAIEPNPAGGHFVIINGQKHYVPHGMNITVKVGDTVEAGDVLSDGIPNPAKVVEHKGIGEGRRYFVQVFRDALTSSGLRTHRRNIELLARGLVNHVRLTEELGDFVPDDIMPYTMFENLYTPRRNATAGDPAKLINRYLERPVLHYTIGTRITPRVAAELKEFGVNEVIAHPEPPPFRPEMVRGMSIAAADPDWMTKMYGGEMKRSIIKAVHRGATSNEASTSFVPAMARGVDFGKIGPIQPPEPGWEVDEETGQIRPVRPSVSPFMKRSAEAPNPGRSPGGPPSAVPRLTPNNAVNNTPAITLGGNPPPVAPQANVPQVGASQAGAPAGSNQNQGTNAFSQPFGDFDWGSFLPQMLSAGLTIPQISRTLGPLAPITYITLNATPEQRETILRAFSSQQAAAGQPTGQPTGQLTRPLPTNPLLRLSQPLATEGQAVNAIIHSENLRKEVMSSDLIKRMVFDAVEEVEKKLQPDDAQDLRSWLYARGGNGLLNEIFLNGALAMARDPQTGKMVPTDTRLYEIYCEIIYDALRLPAGDQEGLQNLQNRIADLVNHAWQFIRWARQNSDELNQRMLAAQQQAAQQAAQQAQQQ